VFNVLLQILDDGRLTDSQGRTVDFRNVIVIMTSNIGADLISKNTPLGFAQSDTSGLTYEDMKNKVTGELKRMFRPEFLNRIDEVIVFHKLSRDEIRQIVDLMVARVNRQIGERGVTIELTEGGRDVLVEQNFGRLRARPLRRAIQLSDSSPTPCWQPFQPAPRCVTARATTLLTVSGERWRGRSAPESHQPPGRHRWRRPPGGRPLAEVREAAPALARRRLRATLRRTLQGAEPQDVTA
jgi:hypothetical protein